MILSLLLAGAAGGLVGFLLGATGGGGSLLAIPLLVYVVGVSAQQATLLSLIVVGATALVGAWHKSRQNQVRGLAAVVFSSTGIMGAWVGAHGHRIVPEETVLLLFGLLMIGVSAWNMRRTGVDEQDASQEGCARKTMTLLCVGRALGIGFGVGVLTGFFGVGGGFLIVPALTIVMGFPASVAVGTSLLIIALIAVGGIIGHMESVTIEGAMLACLCLGSMSGVLYGSRLSSTVGDRVLRQSVGALTGSVGLLMVGVHLVRLLSR